MKDSLLDVSVLFALVYEGHARHQDVRDWFALSGNRVWATCAHTQMSVIRLLSSNFAADLNLTPAVAAAFLRSACSHPRHVYWHQPISPSCSETFDWALVGGRSQLPDLYLLALAVVNDGVLVTLDRKINPGAVRNALPSHLLVL